MEGGGLATVTSAFEAPSSRPLGTSTSGLAVQPTPAGNGNGPSDTTTATQPPAAHSIHTLLEHPPTPTSLPQTQTQPPTAPVQTPTEPPRPQMHEPMLPYHPHPHHLDTPSFQFPPLRQTSSLPLPVLSMPHSNPFLSLPHLVQMSLAGGSKQGESGFQHDTPSLLSLVGSGNGSQLGSDGSSATTSTPTASSSGLRTSLPSGVDRPVFINLKEREEVAKAAYRAWFRLKPGHKELKDRWWAIYYRKISPRFHLRDNYLGRKINEWIEEDMATRKQTDPEFAQLVANYRKATKPGRKPKPLVPREDGTPSKKRKPNSSKEGNLPAYLNVELVHPPKDDPNNPDVKLLMAASDDGDIDWSNEDLETDIEWFKQNRQAIMDGIPSLSNRLKGVNFTSALLSLANATPAQRRAKIDDIGEVVVDVTEGDWVKIDIHRVHDSLIFKADIPGLSPSDLVGLIQSDGNNKIAIKGTRKRDYNDDLPESNQPILSERSFGKFEVHLTLPSVADARKTEQVYCNGVLTLKVPIRQQEWIALDIQNLC